MSYGALDLLQGLKQTWTVSIYLEFNKRGGRGSLSRRSRMVSYVVPQRKAAGPVSSC